ncbi:MAG TPA: serine/threonine-protein kinase [Gemmatimonadales bacterium]|nr:serine/threonine-protein kinase [Gemmatimonadales bacterium]
MSDIPERLAAALSDRYVLERPVGTGGMATVYLARDLRHKRQVAVKVVRPELGGRLGVERFLREIELAARLQHPNILPVFDSGVIDDGDGGPVPYFVMPYVEGQTLRQQLQREGRFPVDAALTLAEEVADALAYAHSKGVVHRDIKPENILLSGGHAVVADFGVAKALEQGTSASPSAGATQLTRAGMAMGTPLYMSPEQATGDDVVDARSDQYSLACVLYEMLAGKPPFEGPSAQTIIAKSLTAPRPHIASIRAGVSSELDQVVAKALSLEPGDRYPDMGALRSALAQARGLPGRGARRWLVGSGALAVLAGVAMGAWFASRPPSRRVAPAVEMLAVLPFHTSGPGMEFLSEGMMDLLATNLKGVGGINTVDPRTVLKEWGNERGQGSDILARALAVGRDLDAGSVVLGSAVSTGGKVRVVADLYGIDGQRLGRAQVDGAADSVLAVVDRLSLALLRDVWRSKEPLPNLRLASLTTDSIDALRSYLEGERYYRRTQWDSALSAYTRAVETDSTFALAHLRRAQAFGWIGGYNNKDAHAAVAAGVRFAKRLPPRDRRLMAAYQLFDQGKPASIDSLRAFVIDYPEDVEGWFLLGEAMFHIKSFRPSAPDSIVAAFDSVLRKDSTLFPALIHPMELGVIYRDSTRFARYFPEYSRTAPTSKVSAIRTTANLLWGPPPTDKAISATWNEQGSWLIQAANAAYYWDKATSDSIASRYVRVTQAGPRAPGFLAGALEARASMLAGLGRWREAKVLLDSLSRLDRGDALGVQAWAMALGLAPVSTDVMDSAVAALPAGPEAELGKAMVNMLRGQVPEGRRRLARALTDSARMSSYDRGMMVAADGWGALIQGDTARGLPRLRSGIDLLAAPGVAAESAFPRLQLALGLAARKETREEGITYLRYGFDNQPLYLPLLQLALGRTHEAAGQRDSAAAAYSRFLRLWDKADPELQGRVQEARAALQEVTRER